MPTIHPTLALVTDRLRQRSAERRQQYLEKIRRAAALGPRRGQMACSNLAHGSAACGPEDKAALAGDAKPNIAIVTAYNDMLSAHQPFATFPRQIKDAVRTAGGVAQVAGGVPAMCDGVTQGRAGMELSLLSRDVIAMATAVALSHDMFEGVVCLGVCDKIVPGLLIGALSFGHLPVIFMPAGPMPSGLPNPEKQQVRQQYAAGDVGREELLRAESAAYHSPGTCTFYGTANSNQMLMEILGLHLPGASFENPNTAQRHRLTEAGARRITELAKADPPQRLGEMIDERAIANAVVGLLATGGSTNHTLHLVAIATAAGIELNWDDFDQLSAVVPLLARVYPNGPADVNHFHAAGGLAVVISELLDAGLLHGDVTTVADGQGLEPYRQEARLVEGELTWVAHRGSRDLEIIGSMAKPFQPVGGLRVLDGNLGRAVVKTSSVKAGMHSIEAPAVVFEHPDDLEAAFAAGELERDLVAVVRFQGPRANGMPELHKLMPALGVLQDRGYRVALVTDGRLSGASGKVLSAIHVTPEALGGGPLARLRTGDRIRIDAQSGGLRVLVSEAVWAARRPVEPPAELWQGTGRELFSSLRAAATGAEQGAVTFGS